MAPSPPNPEQPEGGVPPLRPGDEGPFLLVGTREHDERVLPRLAEVQRLSSIIIPVFTGELRRFHLDRLDGFRGYPP